MLSREKARREEAWGVLEASFEKQERVTGVIFGKVKGGFTVDLSGATAFLPGSEVDIRPVRDLGPLGHPQPFQILKIDRRRGNIVVSRRAVLEESRAEARSELVRTCRKARFFRVWSRTSPIMVRSLTLAVLTAFCMSPTSHGSASATRPRPCRSAKPSRYRSSASTRRPSVSRSAWQLQSDPWESVEGKFPIGSKLEGRVTNITDYGAFVELEAGVEGLVHVSEMSWTKKNVHPGKIVSTSQQVEVMVLDVDLGKRRISLVSSSAVATWKSTAPPTRLVQRSRRDPQHHRVWPVCRADRGDRRSRTYPTSAGKPLVKPL